jgi:CRP-like cAMP-binding protein
LTLNGGETPSQERLLERLSTFSLFADLSRSQLNAIAHEFEEAYFARDERVLRRGLRGSGFYLILEGSATVRVNGQVENRVIPGDFFGEISVLLDLPPSADVVAETELRCLILPAASLERILIAHPHLAFRMLQVEARRLRRTTEGRG